MLLHEGGLQTGTYDQCTGISGPIVNIATNLSPSIDLVVTGHTHQPYVCNIPDRRPVADGHLGVLLRSGGHRDHAHARPAHR